MTDYDEVLMGMVPVSAEGETEHVGFVRAGATRFREPFFDEALEKLTLAGPIQTVSLTFAELARPSARASHRLVRWCFTRAGAGRRRLDRMLGHASGDAAGLRTAGGGGPPSPCAVFPRPRLGRLTRPSPTCWWCSIASLPPAGSGQ